MRNKPDEDVTCTGIREKDKLLYVPSVACILLMFGAEAVPDSVYNDGYGRMAAVRGGGVSFCRVGERVRRRANAASQHLNGEDV
jgi:hypothetical protein